MSETVAWSVAGFYIEACNCELVCPCWTGQAPTYGFCEGNCGWHIKQGQYGALKLDGLNVVMVQRVEGHMRENRWKCRFYIDDRATSEQFDALRNIFTVTSAGHLGKIFRALWEVQSVERAAIEMKSEGWRHRMSILGKLGLAVGILKPDQGPQLCRIPNIYGISATAEEDWFDDGTMKFDHRTKNALTTTFEYQSD
ncbi:MAG: DUF1326 domain-containing protein [Thermodesulfovibrionales bacterium]